MCRYFGALSITTFFLPLALSALAAVLPVVSGAGSTIPRIEILVSSSSDATLYSCFFTNGEEAEVDSGREACCKGILEVWQQQDDNADANFGGDETSVSSIELFHRRCLLEIARVPRSISRATTPNGRSEDAAKYSWMMPSNGTSSGSAIRSGSVVQFLGTNSDSNDGGDGSLRMESVRTTSPYHKTIVPQPSTPKDHAKSVLPIATKVVSRLGRDGGMHRLFHHSFRIPIAALDTSTDEPRSNLRFFLYLTVPAGMFIDLDDPFEPPVNGRILLSPTTSTTTTKTTTKTKTKTTSSSTDTESHGFVTTCLVRQPTTDPRHQFPPAIQSVSFRARLHAATICDIEQPSFVSGQHLLVWELDDVVVATAAAAVETRPEAATTAAGTARAGTEAGHASTSVPIEFATKLHLRYPHPSSTPEEWIDLPSPLLLAFASADGHRHRHHQHQHQQQQQQQQQQQHRDEARAPDDFLGEARHNDSDNDNANGGWTLEWEERVWVAAGRYQDHDFIMGMTISFCLIGVAIMLRDISSVSLWDDA